MKESYLYKKIEDKKIQCATCSHNCVIDNGRFGICGVRQNIEGKLYALNYGKAISESIDPIEKKPFFHFLPNTNSLSIATVGCNMRCGNCQNWQISQIVKTDKGILNIGQNISPKKVVEDALKNKCESISYTYTEPTIFLEYALDTMKLARMKNIKNAWVTNGFMSKETLNVILPYLDAANVDLKSFDDKFYKTNCGASITPILENIVEMKKKNIWVEITTLIIPTLSDDEKMLKNLAEFISKKVGVNTPWHISAFSGEISWKMRNIPNTEIRKIHSVYKIGKEAGLKYVYAGNTAGNSKENTYCPKCGELAIKRIGFLVDRKDKNGMCKKCGSDLEMIL